MQYKLCSFVVSLIYGLINTDNFLTTHWYVQVTTDNDGLQRRLYSFNGNQSTHNYSVDNKARSQHDETHDMTRIRLVN